MSFIDRLLFRKSAAAQAMVLYRTGQAAPRSVNALTFAREGYERNSDVHAAVKIITTAAKGVPWCLYKVSNRAITTGWSPMQVRKQLMVAQALGGRSARMLKMREFVKAAVLVPVDSHPLLDLMAQPNPQQDWTELIESLVGFYCVAGENFINRVGPDDPRKPPLELWPLRPDRTHIVVGDATDPVRGYRYGRSMSDGVPLDPAFVLQMKAWNPTNDFRGLSPIMAAAKRIDWLNASEDWNLAIMQNGGQPAGAVKVETELTPDQRKDLKQWVDEEYSGKANVGRPLLLEGGMDWQQLALTPQEAAWIAGGEQASKKVAIVLGVPPEMLGDSQNKTFANYSEARKSLYQETVLPLLDMIAGKLNGWLVPLYGDGLLLAYDDDGVEALQEDRDSLWARVEAAGSLTVDEKREALGYGPLPNGLGQVVLISATMVPLSAPSATPTGDGTGSTSADGPLHAKAINLPDYDAKTTWWKAVDRQRGQIEQHVLGMVQRTFDSERKAVVAAVTDAGHAVAAGIAADRAIDAHRATWEGTLKHAYLAVAEVFAHGVMQQIEKQAGAPLHAKAKDDAWQRYVLEWLGTRGAAKVTHITDTTRAAVQSALTAGIQAGEGTDAIAKRITDAYQEFTPYRASVIARTETIAASNLGGRAGAKATGLPLQKEWIATRDDRTRDSHLDADGETQPMDSPYTVDGDSLMFPGDDSLGASAGNIIQCRCTESYTVVQDDGSGDDTSGD